MFELFSPEKHTSSLFGKGPNRWDWALLPLVLATIVALAFGAMQMSRPFTVGQSEGWPGFMIATRNSLQAYVLLR